MKPEYEQKEWSMNAGRTTDARLAEDARMANRFSVLPLSIVLEVLDAIDSNSLLFESEFSQRMYRLLSLRSLARSFCKPG